MELFNTNAPVCVSPRGQLGVNNSVVVDGCGQHVKTMSKGDRQQLHDGVRYHIAA